MIGRFNKQIIGVIALNCILANTAFRYSLPSALENVDALRPMATGIEKKMLHAEFIKGVSEVIGKPQGNKQIKLSGENIGGLTALKKAEYMGKTYYAKFILVEKITENTTEDNLITPGVYFST